MEKRQWKSTKYKNYVKVAKITIMHTDQLYIKLEYELNNQHRKIRNVN